MQLMLKILIYLLHKVAQIKLKPTKHNLIGEGINLPINIVIKDTTFKGNRQ